MPNAPKLRAFKLTDYQQVADSVLKNLDGSGNWEKRFRWMFVDNPAVSPDRDLGWVFEDEKGSIVGHTMAKPNRFQVFGQEQYVGFSGDTFISPDYRGMKLGDTLFDAYIDGQKDGLALTTSANDASQYLWDKAKATSMLGDQNHFLYLLNTKTHVKNLVYARLKFLLMKRLFIFPTSLVTQIWMNRRKQQPPGNIEVFQVLPEDPIFDEIWEAHKSDYPVTAVRDSKFVKWRYRDDPADEYWLYVVKDKSNPRNIAWFSFRKKIYYSPDLSRKVSAKNISGKNGVISLLRHLFIGLIPEMHVIELLDVFGCKDDEFMQSVITSLIAACKSHKVDAIVTQGFSPETRQVLPKCGFLTVASEDKFFLCKNMSKIDNSLCADPANFHVTPADGDLGLG